MTLPGANAHVLHEYADSIAAIDALAADSCLTLDGLSALLPLPPFHFFQALLGNVDLGERTAVHCADSRSRVVLCLVLFRGVLCCLALSLRLLLKFLLEFDCDGNFAKLGLAFD